MQYGYFDNKNREYVITRPDTPKPWMNYIGYGGYGGIVSNTGGGLSFDGDPSNRRILRYKFNNQPIDRPGRYIYIRDMDTGEYWSPAWQPVMKKLEFYECRHGLGYTVITGTYSGIEASITFFVPPGARYEIWHLKLVNRSGRPRNLRLFSYVEFSWSDAKYDVLSHWPCMAFQAGFENGKIIVDTMIQQFSDVPMLDYISTDFPIDGYDCSLREFVGVYSDESRPAVLESGVCKNSRMDSDNCVGVLSSSITLAGGETAEGRYTLGAVENRADIDQQIAQAFDRNNNLSQIAEYWDRHCSMLQVDTPDDEVNMMLNIWHAYQAKTTFDWSRFISFYERGVDRGFGFRDSMQDVHGILHSMPQQAKERIKLLLSIQRSDGNAKIVYFPATGKSTGGDRSDDHLWSPFSVCQYIRETGDASIAYDIVPYVDSGEGTVLDHLDQGLRFTMNNLGRHGIPDMLGSDWNDSLAPMNKRKGGGAESIFVFFQLAHAAYELEKLYTFLGENERLPFITEIYDYCCSKLDMIWDGEWFLRAFTVDGEPYGTRNDSANRLYLNPQSWAVLSRLAGEKRGNLIFDRVMEHLVTEYGVITHSDASPGYDFDNKSYYLFPSGARENGGIFFHSNTWAIIALTMLGRSEDAWKCYQSSLPCRRNDDAELHLTEPYVYSQTMLAPPHSRPWQCVNSWLTGTASWMYLTATQYILGVRPDYDGLCIDPCIPAAWDGFSMTRKCRGMSCRISVKRGDAPGLRVDGVSVQGKTVPWNMLHEDVNIEYVMQA